MPQSKNVHVVPHDGHWDVMREGSTRPLSEHETQEEAYEAGRNAAQRSRGEVFLHGSDGQRHRSDVQRGISREFSLI